MRVEEEDEKEETAFLLVEVANNVRYSRTGENHLEWRDLHN